MFAKNACSIMKGSDLYVLIRNIAVGSNHISRCRGAGLEYRRRYGNTAIW